MKYQHMLIPYVIGVVVALAVMLCLTRFLGGAAHFKSALTFALGFLAGMLSMNLKWILLTRP